MYAHVKTEVSCAAPDCTETIEVEYTYDENEDELSAIRTRDAVLEAGWHIDLFDTKGNQTLVSPDSNAAEVMDEICDPDHLFEKDKPYCSMVCVHKGMDHELAELEKGQPNA